MQAEQQCKKVLTLVNVALNNAGSVIVDMVAGRLQDIVSHNHHQLDALTDTSVDRRREVGTAKS